jgi:OFA family oxalate/formate antiporter-like MFS transporter
MSEQKSEVKLYNRKLIVVGAILVQFGLGILYSWGIISTDLDAYFSNSHGVLWAFAAALAFFAVAMIPAGKLHDKYGPKIMALIGGIILGTSYLLCSLLLSEAYVVLMYGVVGGLGIGIAYVCPIACAGKWYPDKKGLITGLAVAGFGLGSVAFNFIFQAFLTALDTMFIVSGIVLYLIIIPGALLLRNPPQGYKPAGWNPPAPKAGAVKKVDWVPSQMVKTSQFWLWWLSFIISVVAGLLVIGSYKAYVKFNPDYLDLGINFAVIGSVAGCGNAIGRISWGKIGDKIGRYKTLAIMNIIQAVVMFAFAPMNTSYILAILMVTFAYFCFGGNLAIYPAITADNFGTKNYGINYGLMFSAYGIGGFLQAVFTILILPTFESWTPLFVIMAIFSLVACTILLLVKKEPIPKST